MKYLSFPIADDQAALIAVAQRMPVAGCRYLKKNLQIVRSRYDAYHAACGNPFAPTAPQPLKMKGKLQKALLCRYETPSEQREFIKTIRHLVSPDVCPMCGGGYPSTTDHVFPRSIFKELAIYSKNLVPACSCNINRSNIYMGVNPGERVLHPYYDSRMDERLVRASICSYDNSYRTPIITLELVIPTSDSLYSAVKFHVEKVILQTNILNTLGKLWSNFQRSKNGVLNPLGDIFTDDDFDQVVSDALDSADAEFNSRNSWKSILLSFWFGC